MVNRLDLTWPKTESVSLKEDKKKLPKLKCKENNNNNKKNIQEQGIISKEVTYIS